MATGKLVRDALNADLEAALLTHFSSEATDPDDDEIDRDDSDWDNLLDGSIISEDVYPEGD
jgi:hypothetical protein